MKRLYAFVLLLAFTLVGTQSLMAQAQGGPDAWGYNWKSDTAFNGPVYNWIDISTTGTEVTGLADDNFSAQLNLGFSFPYYWFNYDKLWVGANGYVIFDQPKNIASSGAAHFTQNPSGGTSASNYIALFLTDLTLVDGNGGPVPGAKCYFWTNNTDSAVVSYVGVPYWTDETATRYRGANSFQIVFVKNSTDTSFTINYQNISRPGQGGGPDGTYTASGNFMVRGFENTSGTVGLSFPINVYPDAASSVQVKRTPPAVPLDFKDLTPEWAINPSNNGLLLVKGSAPFSLQTKVKNIGTTAINAQPIAVRLNVLDYINGNTPIFRDTLFLAGLTAGQETTLTFNKTLQVNTAGIYNVRVEVDAGTQEGNNTSNNLRFAEIVVVDTTTKPVVIGYDRYVNSAATPFDQTNDGFNSTFKVGMYITPPYYPFDVKAVRYQMFARDNSKTYGFTGEILADNNGVPGTSRWTGSISGDSVSTFFFFTGLAAAIDLKVDPPVRISSGGAFVSFKLDAPDSARFVFNALCSDDDGPASYRTYEITAGSWAPYRDRASSDFGIELVSTSTVTSRGNNQLNQKGFNVGQNYPNPSATSTIVPFNVVQKGAGSITVRNVMGQVIATYDLGIVIPGSQSYEMNTSSLSSGVYTYTVRVGSEEGTRRMTIGTR
jgi:hypothetical protein